MKPIKESDIARALANDFLHLTIMPTEMCNLRCTYCYEKFVNGTMSANVSSGIKKLIGKRIKELKVFDISWFGGEPLLAQNVIYDIMEYTNAIKHSRLNLRSGMTTNGCLLDISTFKKLLKCGINKYQITFDGPKELHDRKRAAADGSGSFDRIWTNLESIRAAAGKFKIQIRLHLDYDNYPYIRQFIKDYTAAFKEDERFILFFRPLSRLGGKNDPELQIISTKDIRHYTDETAEYLKTNNIRYQIMDDLPAMCSAARLNSFGIRSNGNIHKCNVALEHKINLVGNINTDGTLSINRGNFMKWCRGIKTGSERELRCPLNGIDSL